LCGLFLRLSGTKFGLSYWNDESHTALFSRGILLGGGGAVVDIGTGTGIYQVALYYTTAISFKLFGTSEFAGRFPSVLAGAILILLGYIIIRKILGFKEAIITSFLLAFSQIQLAWSTQLRPYVWLELFTLLVVYYLYKNIKSTDKLIDTNFGLAIVFSLVATLFHGTGLISFGIIFFVVIYKSIKGKRFRFLASVPLFSIVLIVLLYGSYGNLNSVISILLSFRFSPLHYRIFLTHNYLWLIIGASVGFFALYKRNRELALLLGGSIVFIFAIAIFKINPNYVRYSLPAFPLLYVLFAEGVVSIIDKVSKKEYLRWTLVIFTFMLLSFTGKFSFRPQYYYSINADVRENPIVDYKLAFAKIQTLIKDKKEVILMDAWNDRVPWYLPGQEYIFLTKNGAGKADPVFGEKMIGTIAEFEVEKKSFPSGVVIVEDWQSQTPEDLKEHIRKNLKFEFMVQDLPYNENDHWGISVYSWGI